MDVLFQVFCISLILRGSVGYNSSMLTVKEKPYVRCDL